MGVPSFPRVTRIAKVIVGGDAHLMGEDAGVDGARLLHLVARRPIRIDTVDTHRTRIVKRHQEMSEGMSVVRWMGRVGSRIGAPCGVSAPLAGSMRRAVT